MPPGFDDQLVTVVFGLGQLVVLSMILERGLYFFFDFGLWRDFLSKYRLRGPISFGVSWFICWYYDFDILSRVLDPNAISQAGIFITAAIVAGGSIAAIKLFQDVLKFSREGRIEKQELNKLSHEAATKEVKARIVKADTAIK
jgi:hypothetical protein